jgi:hypothetical protein
VVPVEPRRAVVAVVWGRGVGVRWLNQVVGRSPRCGSPVHRGGVEVVEVVQHLLAEGSGREALTLGSGRLQFTLKLDIKRS